MTSTVRRKRSTGRVTLAEVATLAGVSAMTVSRVLHGDGAVSPELSARVKAAVDKLGYLPDPAARALASRHGSHVAILIPMLSNEVFVDLLDGAQRTLRAAGLQALIGITHYDPVEEEQLLREQLLHRPAGVLITGTQHSAATAALIETSKVPCIHLMEVGQADASLSTGSPTGMYCVGFSQQQAGAALTRHLLSRGHKRIAFAAAQLDPRTLQRMAGWRQALQEQGLYDPTLEWKNPEPSSMGLGAHMFHQIMGHAGPVDAIFFCNDDLAQGALLEALRMGIAVPGRVAVAGFNDLKGSAQMLPALTTVRTPRAAVGIEAAKMLLELIRGEQPRAACRDLGFEIVVRAST
jgi:LacI family gluconate utilization system Gnt-I transcriptional repressor